MCENGSVADVQNLKNFYKVIIIGAGPAGLSAAINLYNCGIYDVLVVERNKFPRYKCCAGYITNKTKLAYEKLGLNIQRCHYSLIKDFNILYKLKPRLKIDNKFLYTNEKIDRVELDNAFYELAASKGVNIIENTKVCAHAPENNSITLSCDKTLGYEYLIFADGTTGFGSRYQQAKRKNIALQLTFQSEREEQIAIHFGITKRGYGWVSSYGGVTNVGLTDVYDSKINYRQKFIEFLDGLDIKADVGGLKGAFTPIGMKKPVMFKNVYFVGDAAGACDPLTLSGLRYALKSGELCAGAISENKPKIYLKHARKLKIKFWFMKVMLKLFYLKAFLFLTFNVSCRFLGKLVSYVFNNFFVNKK